MIFSPKQKEYIQQANAVWNFKIGAVRSGKTFIDYRYVIPANIRQRAKKDGLNLILGVTESTIERNVLEPMRKLYGESLVGHISSNNEVRLFDETAYAIGMEKVGQLSKIQGTSAKYVYGDEVPKWNEKAFLMLASRLDKTYSRFDGTGNPESPYHYLKEFIENDKTIYCQHYTIDDNPFLPQEVKERLKRQYVGVYEKRYIKGLWSMAEGAIYDMWRDEINIIDELDITPEGYLTAIDYGTASVCTFGLFAYQNEKVRMIKQYYYNAEKAGRQKTDVEYRNDYANFVTGFDVEYGYIDPSAASFMLELRSNGFNYLRPADNDVLSGIKKVQSKIAKGDYKIMRNCAEAIREKSSYCWDKKAQLLGEDKPLKIDDHSSDIERYLIYSHFRRD
jgi:phage terminase, large subunit, PBSX family